MNSSQYCLVKGKTLAWRDVLPRRKDGRSTGPRIKTCKICGHTSINACDNKACKLSMNEYYRCLRNGIKFIPPTIIR